MDDVYDILKDLYHANMFDWDTMPEPCKKEAQKITRETLDQVLTMLEKANRNKVC